MKKRLVLTVLAMATLAMAGCAKKNDNDTSSNERALEFTVPDIDEKPTATPEATEASVEVEPQDETETDDIAELLSDPEYTGAIEEYTDQFLQYAALCMQYEGSYAGEYLDDTMMRNAIAYTEALGTTTDSTGIEYSDYGYPYITSERFEELAYRYFRVELDNSGLPDMSDEALYDNLLAKDDEGNIYVLVGDWGTRGPMGYGVVLTYEDNMIVATQSIDMYDYELDEVAYELGSYTLKLFVDPEDPYDFYIADFTLD